MGASHQISAVQWSTGSRGTGFTKGVGGKGAERVHDHAMEHRDWVCEGRMEQRGFAKVVLHDGVLPLMGAVGAAQC